MHQKETRERIMEQAWRLLETDGAAQVRMADVAKAAGVSRQAVYLHFGSRAGLLLELAEHIDDQQDLGALVAWVGEAASPEEILNRVVRLQAEYNPRIDALAAAFQHAAPKDADVAAAFQGRLDDRLRGARGVIERLTEWDALKPELEAHRAAELAWAILSLAVWRSLVIDRGWSPDEYCEHVSATLRAALLAQA